MIHLYEVRPRCDKRSASAVNALIAASFRRNHADMRNIESGFESRALSHSIIRIARELELRNSARVVRMAFRFSAGKVSQADPH